MEFLKKKGNNNFKSNNENSYYILMEFLFGKQENNLR